MIVTRLFRTASLLGLLGLLLGTSLPPLGHAEVGRARHYYSDTLTTHFQPQMSDQQVRAKLLELIPVLKDGQAAEARKVEAVRDWIHSFLPVADQHNNLNDQGVDHHQNPLGELLHLAESRVGGYYCGASTEISRQIYRLLGFDAHSMNFGVGPNGATHLTTVVLLSVNGLPTWTIQDTYFNFTVRYQDGRYADFRNMLKLLVEGRTDELVIDENPNARTPSLYLSSQKIPRMSRKYELDAVCIRQFPNFTEFSLKWDFELMLLLFGLRENLEEALGTNHPLYLFAYPLSTSGNDKVLALQDYALAAQASMRENVAQDPKTYAATRIDDYLAPHLERIRNWPIDG